VFENFFENFKRQIKDPTRFDFFRVPREKWQEVVQKLQEALKSPDKLENKDFLDVHRIKQEDFEKKQEQEEWILVSALPGGIPGRAFFVAYQPNICRIMGF
jgi:hypothetical protein